MPVYVYRLRKILRIGDGGGSLIARDRCGYRLVSGAVDVDLARMEEFVAAAGKAERVGALAEALRSCSRALDLFRGEPLAGLPGPFVELERLRLAERRISLARRRAGWQLRLGRTTETITELFALAAAEPLDEPIAVLLMRALHHSGRQAEALAVLRHGPGEQVDDRNGRGSNVDLDRDEELWLLARATPAGTCWQSTTANPRPTAPFTTPTASTSTSPTLSPTPDTSPPRYAPS